MCTFIIERLACICMLALQSQRLAAAECALEQSNEQGSSVGEGCLKGSPYRDGYKRLERPPFVCVGAVCGARVGLRLMWLGGVLSGDPSLGIRVSVWRTESGEPSWEPPTLALVAKR